MSWLPFLAGHWAHLFWLLVPLVIFYFLKLKRPRMEIPSLALWRSAASTDGPTRAQDFEITRFRHPASVTDIGGAASTPAVAKKRRTRTMNIGLNRTLDLLATLAVLGLGFILAGATAALGA